jgi:hypothetical protein
MVSTPELTMVVSTDTVDLVRFHFFFLASVSGLRRSWSWPGRIVCLVRRGATTLDGALRDVEGASSSLPTVELERYSLMGGGGAACTSAASWTL